MLYTLPACGMEDHAALSVLSKDKGGTLRTLAEIAQEIKQTWRNVAPAAFPYLVAMGQLRSIHDNYIMDTGHSIVLYFLSNAGSWRGDDARRIKAELNRMVNSGFIQKAA